MLRYALLLIALAGPLAPQAREVQRLFERGRDLFEEHDDSGEAAQEAETAFRQALARDPRFAPAIAYLGFLALDRQQPTEAEAAFRRVLRNDATCAEARVGLAHLHLAAGRRAEALQEVRTAVRAHPENRLALWELATDLTTENFPSTDAMWREAMTCWQTLLRLNAGDRDAHHSLAKAYERFGNWTEAESHYREVLRIGQTSEDSDVWVYSVHGDVARMAERQGKYQEAIREYEALSTSEGAGDEEIGTARREIEVLRRKLAAPAPRP
jgi:tetratricopeptide (TPR) repeat protein